jgi:uncharacterized protein (TIGR02266 family)
MSRTSTILVVDDVSMFRDLAALFLARTARVIKASSGDEALRILAEEKVDLVVTDLHMPGMDGDQLCRSIKKTKNLDHLPVLIMLRSGSDEDSTRAVRAGADDMICKPISRTALIEGVNHFLESGLIRGLPRVDVTIPVELRNELLHTWGTARNISRGGIYVETDCLLEPKAEVAVEMVLPQSHERIAPVAEVIWSRDDGEQRITELGMRFLSIDSDTMRRLDDFIGQYILPRPASAGTP